MVTERVCLKTVLLVKNDGVVCTGVRVTPVLFTSTLRKRRVELGQHVILRCGLEGDKVIPGPVVVGYCQAHL